MKTYERLLSDSRQRESSKAGRSGRTLEEEADADRGRVLFCAPFRRLQNKAQVFSLETNAAVRSRLTHSLEVSSIGRYVAQQAYKSFSKKDQARLGLSGKERPFITFVETACLIHDLGNPPFGHFGEITISDWFHQRSAALKPQNIAGKTDALWQNYFHDFVNFDGNPQGFRIVSKLQPTDTLDLCGLNLTATTLAATLKYPWSSEQLSSRGARKAGYFQTEQQTLDWLRSTFELPEGARHPLVYLMEAADDIAYCISDIEDGIEKGLLSASTFCDQLTGILSTTDSELANYDADSQVDLEIMFAALNRMKSNLNPTDDGSPIRLTPLQDFRSAVIRILARVAGSRFNKMHDSILTGNAEPLLAKNPILEAIKSFAYDFLYNSAAVRNMEITAHAVIFGLLDAFLPMMNCERERFEQILDRNHSDSNNRRITQEVSLAVSFGGKHLSVYRESVRRSDQEESDEVGNRTVLERIHRMRLIVDNVSGMTDEYALQYFQLISGARTLR